MGFNSAFKGLIVHTLSIILYGSRSVFIQNP